MHTWQFLPLSNTWELQRIWCAGTSNRISYLREFCEASARRVDPPQSRSSTRRTIMHETRDLLVAASDLRHDHARGDEKGSVGAT